MTNPPKKRSLAVLTLAGFGYLSLVMQWLWTTILFLPLLLENDTFKDFIVPKPSPQTEQAVRFGANNSLLISIIAVIVTILVLGLTIVILIRLPIAVAKASKKSVESGVNVVMPLISHHKKLPKKKQERIRFQIRSSFKIILALVPFLGLFAIYFVPTAIEPPVAALIGTFLFVGTIIWFGLEQLVARLLKLDYQSIP